MTSGRDILDFVLNNRRRKAFKDFSPFDIMSTVSDAASVNGLGMLEGEDGKLSAIAVGFPYETTKDRFLHIHTVLTTKPGDLKHLLRLLMQRFPGFILTARRRGKFVRYTNTPRLIEKLWVTSDKAHKKEWQTSWTRSSDLIQAQ